MNAKEYLFSLNITDNPGKSLFVKRDDNQFDMAQVMEDYAKLSPAAQLIEVISKSGSSYVVANDTNFVGVCNTDSFGHSLDSMSRVTHDPWPGILTD